MKSELLRSESFAGSAHENRSPVVPYLYTQTRTAPAANQWTFSFTAEQTHSQNTFHPLEEITQAGH